MELRYVIITIIKILISVPCIILITTARVRAAALMGGYLDNNSNSTNFTISNLYESDLANVPRSNSSYYKKDDGDFDETMEQQEEIPDPSALVVPGYNLPENIFNKGKPFYLEKDPLTGKVDFDSRASLLDDEDDEFDYVDGDQLYDKSNIDRKDGNIGSHHKGSDVNQLTPNFHDFLNLPVKYNSDKYVYPLISSSYANTKVQGNLHKYQTMNNHKDYSVTTYKPTMSPNHFYTVKTPYYNPNNPVQKPVVPQITTTTTITTTSTTTPTTTKLINLMDNAMNHLKTETPKPTEIYLTTSNIDDIYLTTKRYSAPPTTTKRTLSLFEQLFGDYEDEYAVTSTTTERPKTPPSLFQNLPSNKNKSKYDYPEYVEENTVKSKETEENNVLSGTGMGHESAYEYEDDYSGNMPNESWTKPAKVEVKPATTTSITTSPPKPTTTEATTTLKVTSLPLGENHFETSNYQPPIIAITHNLKEKLNSEKVIPNTSKIQIFPYQDSVSFIVQNHPINTPDFIGSVFKEGSFDNGPFKPLIAKSSIDKDTVSYTVNAKPEYINKPFPKTERGGSVVRIQPIKTSEASLSIGVPLNEIQKVPGQVVDENIENEDIEFPKTKIVFPEEKESKTSTFGTNLQPPPTDREVLQLSSKPMYHQLPSDLTPPNEQDLPRPRPPWDPRPGHFYNGRPEYIRPPRPQPRPTQGEAYKRVDNLPNILPQFRPNVKHFSGGHYFDHYAPSKNGYIRQPLLERPSNKPIGFFEKLVPPPPPLKNFNLRKVPVLEQPPPEDSQTRKHEQFEFYRHPTPPPQPVLINRRKSDEPTVETLQMIQAKQTEKKETKLGMTSSFKTSLKGKESTEKPLYVVYPVNSAPIKLDALETHKRETVVVGTRAELPLPPSKINQEFNYESPQDRNDSPILKPHPKPSTFPIKSDFPYPLERPDITSIASTFPNGNNLDVREDTKSVQDTESRILTGPKINYKNPNQISVTLKTYTEKPIAVAYTPTEPYRKPANTERYSMPNYASPVISEIRPSGLMDKSGSEITVSAVMHTQPQHQVEYNVQGRPSYENHKSDEDQTPTKLEFQAPFQASLNIDAMSQGWKVVKSDKPKIDRSDDQEVEETTTVALATTSEFDIKNFKPQFFSGFKPIYSYPEDDIGSEKSV